MAARGWAQRSSCAWTAPRTAPTKARTSTTSRSLNGVTSSLQTYFYDPGVPVGTTVERLDGAAQLGVEQIANAVAQQVEGQHRQCDGPTREEHQPPWRHQAGIQRTGQHVAADRGGRRDADAQEAQAGLDYDGDAEMGGGEDQIGCHALRQDVAEHQTFVRGADAARGLDILHLLERQHD